MIYVRCWECDALFSLPGVLAAGARAGPPLAIILPKSFSVVLSDCVSSVLVPSCPVKTKYSSNGSQAQDRRQVTGNPLRTIRSKNKVKNGCVRDFGDLVLRRLTPKSGCITGKLTT